MTDQVERVAWAMMGTRTPDGLKLFWDHTPGRSIHVSVMSTNLDTSFHMVTFVVWGDDMPGPSEMLQVTTMSQSGQSAEDFETFMRASMLARGLLGRAQAALAAIVPRSDFVQATPAQEGDWT